MGRWARGAFKGQDAAAYVRGPRSLQPCPSSTSSSLACCLRPALTCAIKVSRSTTSSVTPFGLGERGRRIKIVARASLNLSLCVIACSTGSVQCAVICATWLRRAHLLFRRVLVQAHGEAHA